MLTKRIIPCLDIKDGRTVKGVKFKGIRDAGDPVELAKKYSLEGADELVFLDISATAEKRKTLLNLVTEVASKINIPFTVGGGISSVQDVNDLLSAGADKVSVNSAAVKNPDLLNQISDNFGSQCLVLAIDAKRLKNDWIVHLVGGTQATDRKLIEWALEGQERGVGELLFTSMDNDGTKNGFANDALRLLNEHLSIPVIASGGAGSIKDIEQAFTIGMADAALAASIFHFSEVSIKELKQTLAAAQIAVRR